MTVRVDAFFDPATNTISYIVADPVSGRAAVIDPVLDFDPAAGRTSTASADRLIAAIEEAGLALDWIIETHVHADHITAGPYLRDKLGGRTGISAGVVAVQQTFGALFNAEDGFAADGSQFDHLFADGETFRLGGIEASVTHTPGHTPACACYVFGDAAFVGDTLFMPDSGTARCDFPGGCADQLYGSLRKILSLPPETRLFMCHDYGAGGTRDPAWETTVAEERRANTHCHDGVSREDYVEMRKERDAQLSMPRLIVPAVQVNIRGGNLPPPEANGTRYLKVPLNVL